MVLMLLEKHDFLAIVMSGLSVLECVLSRLIIYCANLLDDLTNSTLHETST